MAVKVLVAVNPATQGQAAARTFSEVTRRGTPKVTSRQMTQESHSRVFLLRKLFNRSKKPNEQRCGGKKMLKSSIYGKASHGASP